MGRISGGEDSTSTVGDRLVSDSVGGGVDIAGDSEGCLDGASEIGDRDGCFVVGILEGCIEGA